MKKAGLFILALALGPLGCSAGGEARLKIGDHHLIVEVADTPGEQEEIGKAYGIVEPRKL